MSHADAQQFEADWWGDCTQTFGEETKQLTYAHRMGLHALQVDGRWPVYDLQGKSVLDIGGGPVSILLKTINGGRLRTVVDPCPYPEWVHARYKEAGIHYVQCEAENLHPMDLMDDHVPDRWDEVWLYNVLQHVVDPELVIETARRKGSLIRIFEWIEKETNVGHPHTLYAHDLNQWLGGVGTVAVIDENSCHGLAYWGEFLVGAGAIWDPVGHLGTVGPAGAGA